MDNNKNIIETRDEKIYKLLDLFKKLPENLQNQMIEEIISTVQEYENTIQ